MLLITSMHEINKNLTEIPKAPRDMSAVST